jgi:hypothetical protein
MYFSPAHACHCLMVNKNQAVMLSGWWLMACPHASDFPLRQIASHTVGNAVVQLYSLALLGILKCQSSVRVVWGIGPHGI